MTEPNGWILQKPDPDEPRTGVGTMLQAARPESQEPPGTRGRTAIADGMVEKIAGIAAQEVPGLDALGGGFTRTMGAVRDRVPGGRLSAGVASRPRSARNRPPSPPRGEHYRGRRRRSVVKILRRSRQRHPVA